MKRTTSDRITGEHAPARARAARIALASLPSLAGLSVTAALGVLVAHGALAQETSGPCTGIDDDAERLACYDRALRPARPDVPPAAQPRAATPQSAPPAAATPADPAPVGSHIGTASSVEPREARSGRAEAAPAAPGAPAAPAAAAATAGSGAAIDGIVPIVIVNARPIAGRNDFVFTTDGGAEWVQTDNSRVQLPDAPFNAQIKPGVMGSFFLVLDGRNRAIRVRRQE